jgi:hypothetical protein
VLEPGDAVDRLLVAGRVLVSLSSGGKYLRGWSLKDGTLLWEAVTYTAAAPSAEAAKERGADRGVDLLPLGRDADGDGAEDVLVLARGEVQMRSLSDGVIAWTAEAATRCDDERGDAGDDVARFNRLAVVGADDSIVAVGATAERGHPVAAEIDSTSGAIRRVAIATGVQGLDAISKMTVSATDAKEGVAVFGAARDAGAGADEAPTKLFALDLGKLLALAGSRGAGKRRRERLRGSHRARAGRTRRDHQARARPRRGRRRRRRGGARRRGARVGIGIVRADRDGPCRGRIGVQEARGPHARARVVAAGLVRRVSRGGLARGVAGSRGHKAGVEDGARGAARVAARRRRRRRRRRKRLRREVVFARARRRGVAACFSQ